MSVSIHIKLDEKRKSNLQKLADSVTDGNLSKLLVESAERLEEDKKLMLDLIKKTKLECKVYELENKKDELLVTIGVLLGVYSIAELFDIDSEQDTEFLRLINVKNEMLGIEQRVDI